jgi:Zn-dependent protease
MQRDSIRLFRIAGIEVALHFSWFFIAIYQLTSRHHGYTSPIFAACEYVALFGIVLLHEFGHALACRQVGGIANYILLWPFGGIAFVRPPPRPGAQLWSIVAGPLVNVFLIPVLWLAEFMAARSGLGTEAPDLYRLIWMIGQINIVILIFNLLPIFPLDGGQILRSLLWFVIGRVKSLQVASVIGLTGGAVLVLWALKKQSFLFALLAFFLVTQAWIGWRQARALAAEEREAQRVRDEPQRERPVL